MIGQVIGNYRIVSILGQGGMGMVYRAEHVQLGKPAALKMMLPQFTTDPTIVQRFFNEARAASAIDHPGIVEIFDFGTHTDGAAYIVMSLLKGESLEHRLQRGPLAPLEGASIVAQVLGALAAAHQRGIIHRDLKPDNIFLTPNELMQGGIQVKLLDFGIAKLAGEQGQGSFKTQTGMMMGTPAYMSPEQCMGRADLDHRTDLYAVGCILFHVLTGRPPFTGEGGGTGMMIAAHMRDPAPHPRSINPNIPDALCAIVMRLLEKDPAARFQSALEARQALVDAGASAPSKPPTPIDQFGATMAPSYAPYGTAPPTTASGAAAQVVPAAPTVATRGSKAPLVLAIGLVAAAGVGVAVWTALRHTDPPTTTAQAPAPPTTPPTTPPAPDVQPAGRPADKTAATVTADQPACPLGKVRGFDTQGQCCWPEQAFSSAKARCIGTPACPPGHKVVGDECVVAVADAQDAKPASTSPVSPPPHGGSLPPPPPPPPPPPDDPKHSAGTAEAPTFKLDAKQYEPGAPIQITLAAPIISTSKSRAWITVVEAAKPATQYGTWSYLDDGATTIKLAAPSNPGAYEVRLHTDYPTKSTNVRHAVALIVGDAKAAKAAGGIGKNDQRFMLGSKIAKAGDAIEITFPVAMKAADGEKFWITIVQKGAADSAYGTYAYVPDGARTMQFTMPSTAGDYELRLHANYPRLATNLVHRAPIHVEE